MVRSVVNVDGGNVRISHSKRKIQKADENKKLNSEFEMARNKRNGEGFILDTSTESFVTLLKR